MASPAPHGPVGGLRGADEAKSSQLLAMRVELRSVKHHTAVVDYDNGFAVLCRSKFDGAGAETLFTLPLFKCWRRWSTHAQNTSWKVVPFGEISVYRSDPPKARREANES